MDPRRLVGCVLVLLLVGLFASPAPAEEVEAGTVRAVMEVDLLPNGDGKAVATLRMHRAQYTLVKTQFPNAQQFLRDYSSRRSNWELGEGASAVYDDMRSAIRLELTELGGVHNAGQGKWSLAIEPSADFVTLAPAADGRTVAHFYDVGQWPNGVIYRGPVRYRLPAGAREARWNESGRTLEYVLDRSDGTGPPRLVHQIQVKPRLMTAIYKVYGLGADFAAMWVAKSVFRNEGQSVIRNLRVRYRLDGYSEWSPWQRAPELVPGQTAVSNYYPVLRAEIAKLTSNTPANVLAEWRYEDIEGKERDDSDGARVVLLGGHEFVFSNLTQGESYGTWAEGTNNAPFVAAWVSRDDMVVKQFAALANKNSGGLGASSSDENAVKVLQSIYQLMQINDFTYQHPPGFVDKSMSFDVQMVQNIKYPRDVLRDRSGTCIDLAIFYAAVANNVGIKPYLAFIPGHCFPVFELPSGNVVAVEATGVGGGLRHGTAPFDKMLEVGIQELVEARNDGRIHTLDVQTLWTNGVSNPELEPLPADILTQWGIRGDLPPAPGPGPGPGPGPQPVDPRGGAQPVDGFAGTWGGTVTETLQDGSTLTYPMMIAIQRQGDGSYLIRAEARAQVQTPQGLATVNLVEEFVGQVQGDTLVFQGRRKVMTVDGQTVESALDNGRAQVVDGALQGQSGNDADGYTPFRLRRN